MYIYTYALKPRTLRVFVASQPATQTSASLNNSELSCIYSLFIPRSRNREQQGTRLGDPGIRWLELNLLLGKAVWICRTCFGTKASSSPGQLERPRLYGTSYIQGWYQGSIIQDFPTMSTQNSQQCFFA